MPYSSNPYLFERITREIVFSHLTATICQSIILPKIEYQSSRFSSNTDETKLVVNGTEKILMIDQHLSTGFDLKDDLFIIGECQIPIYTEKEKLIDEILSDDFKSTDIIFPDQSLATINDNIQFCNDKQSMKDYLAFFTARHLFRLIKCHRLFSTKTTFPYNFHQLIESIQSNHFEKITDEIISTLTPVTLSGTEFVGFLMPMNLQSDIIKLLSNSNISQENQVQCRFHVLNAIIVHSFDDVKVVAKSNGVCQYRISNPKSSTKYSFKCCQYRKYPLSNHEIKATVPDDDPNSIALILNERDTFGRHKTATLLELNGSLIRTLCWKETLIPNRISWNDLTTLAIAYAKTIKIMSISTETNYEHQSSAPRKYINTG
ncbi:unnamed protein product [Rotaria sordida]|uniref:Uncharacterized protein n=1 Tax=Rotaria sordida TaxID=392033 RepID=A0A813MRL6_9BILA|nr:unnamed protein product [Rotaria sordida]